MDLMVLKTYQSNIVINFIYEPNKWTKVSFNYWMSFRNDIIMAIESFSARAFEKMGNGGQIQSRVDLPQNTKNQACIVLAFMAGVRYNTKNSANIDQHKLSFGIKEQKIEGTILTIQF